MTTYTLPLSNETIDLLANSAGYNVTSNGVNFPGGITLTTNLSDPLPFNYYDLLAANAYSIAVNSYTQANSATVLAQNAYNFANTISGGAAIDNVARVLASSASSNTIILQGVNITQNTRLNSIETINSNQNISISIIQLVDATQNTRLDSVETINTNQNTTISIIQGVDTWQNTQITYVNQFAQAVYDKANVTIGVDATQNTRLNSIETVNNDQNTQITYVNQFAQAAYNKANTGTGSTYGDSNVAAYLPTYTGNLSPTSVGVGKTPSGVAGQITANSIIVSENISDKLGNVRDFTLNTQNTPYTLTANDNAKLINTTASVTIPNGVFTAGQTITLFNNSSSTITITANGVITLYQAATSNTGNRNLAQRGIATIVCVAANTFVISGAGIS